MSKYWDKKSFKFFIVAILSRHKWTGPGQQYTQNITKYIISFLLYGVKSNAENIQDQIPKTYAHWQMIMTYL